MISYSDETIYGIVPSAWMEENGLHNALDDIRVEFGDKVHQSGPADYLVRSLVNPKDISVKEKIRNYFLILVSKDGIDTVTKVGDEEPARGDTITFQESWVAGICDRFRAFRQRLS